jgi:hypothetical protein
MTTKKFRFPASLINTVHQSGLNLTPSKRGVNVAIHAKPNEAPHSAEVYSDDCEEYADLGLEFEGETLTGYDGAFDIPSEVLSALRMMGYEISEDLLDERAWVAAVPDCSEPLAEIESFVAFNSSNRYALHRSLGLVGAMHGGKFFACLEKFEYQAGRELLHRWRLVDSPTAAQYANIGQDEWIEIDKPDGSARALPEPEPLLIPRGEGA